MWDERYDRPDYVFGTAPNAFLAASVTTLALKPGRALCVADGEGRNSVWLAQQGWRVTAMDASSVGIAKARKLAEERHVDIEYYLADIATWDFSDASYDLIAAIFIQFAEPDFRARLFKEFGRALRPGGVLLMQGYRPEQLAYATGGPSNADQLYTKDMLATAFADWDIVKLQSHDSEIHEGAGHSGMSALVDLIARKR